VSVKIMDERLDKLTNTDLIIKLREERAKTKRFKEAVIVEMNERNEYTYSTMIEKLYEEIFGGEEWKKK
jgi:hypothetical protein